MKAEQFERIRALYDEAAPLPGPERQATLQRCDDPEVREFVTRMLAAGSGDTPPLPEVAGSNATTVQSVDPAEIPETIGPFRILREIGSGGMGTVYLAEQTEPVRRKVAVKVLKSGMDSRSVLARFEAERQALAMMDHTGIATMLDAGETAEGRPFFAMEWVQGEPITEYCDRRKLSNRDRLVLFVSVCSAVQHAHQKGVIHRDLKPSNILVAEQDGEPLAKIIDFGIAKAISGSLTDKTLHTHVGQLLGTPEYMSPEQAQIGAVDTDTRTDVYSLGVVLYELLTGVLPFPSDALRQAGYDEICRIIREVDPPRPSSRPSTLGERGPAVVHCRRTGVARLTRQLRGDLDWVLLKSLEKDRARRYESVGDLSQEIERYLADEPVSAGPPGSAYRFRKFAHRHRGAVLVASVVLVAALVAAASLVYALVESERQRAVAERARTESEAVRNFMTEMMRSADPNRELGGPATTVQQVLAAAAEQVAERFGDQPVVEAEIRFAIGSTYTHLEMPAEALPHLRRAFDLQSSLFGRSDRRPIETLSWIGWCELKTYKLEESERTHLEALDLALEAFGPSDTLTVQAMIELGYLCVQQDRPEEANIWFDRAQAGIEATDAGDAWAHYREVVLLDRRVLLYRKQGDWRREVETATERLRLSPGLPEVELMWGWESLGFTSVRLARFPEADSCYVEVMERAPRVLGEDASGTLIMRGTHGRILRELGRYEESEALFQELVERHTQKYGPDSWRTLNVRADLAWALLLQGKTDPAATEALEAIEGLRNSAPPEYEALSNQRTSAGAKALMVHGRCLFALGRPGAARPVLEEADSIWRELGYGRQRRHTLPALVEVYDALDEPDLAEQARQELRDAAEAFEEDGRVELAECWRRALADVASSAP